MEYIKKEKGAYNLHIIKSKHYKTVTIRLYLREEAKKENVTIRDFLNYILFLANKKYPTKKELTKQAQNLYAASMNFNSRRLGNVLDTNYTLRVLNDRYTEEGNLEKAIDLFSSLLFDPKVEDGKFAQDDFETIYEEMKAAIKSVSENKSKYALIRLLEETDKDSAVGINGAGYLEDLEKITPSNLYEYYQEMIKHNLVDIFVLGNVDVLEIEELIAKYFSFTTFKNRSKKMIINVKDRSKAKTVIEEVEANQTQLAIACNITNLTPYERAYPLSIYNVLLGGGENSLLFKKVREEASLAYHISSTPNKFDNLILIKGGIAKGSEKEAIALIKKQLKFIKDKKVKEKEIEEAKEYFTTAIDEIYESPLQIISSYYMSEVLKVDDIETKKKKMMKVTKEEIEKVANKVKIHTIFCLKGKDDEEI